MHDSWKQLIEPSQSAQKSIVKRYHRVLNHLDLNVELELDTVAQCSLEEGVQMFLLERYKGVDIFVLDESSLMTTGTYKDLDACVVSAIAKKAGLQSIAVSSGGNLGYSLSVYGRHSGLNSYFFQPLSTLYKLDADDFAWGGTKLIAVDLPEKQVKSLANLFARTYGIQAVPDIRWRLAASALRAMFVLEHTEGGRSVDSIAQTMCAGYGPAGIYNCFSELSREGLVHRRDVPRFLGFQQEANSPMVRAWSAGEREIMHEHVNARPSDYIEPGLYNTNPDRNYTRLFDLIRHYGGDFATIERDDYEHYTPMILEWFASKHLFFTRTPGTDDVLEKTGLLTMVGIVKAIDDGRLTPGERVLGLITGGFRRLKSSLQPRPDCIVDDSQDEAAWVEHLGEKFGLRALPYSRVSDRLFTRKP